MENKFLDGIDEQFQRLMKLNGNGRRNGHSLARSTEDHVIAEIVDHLLQLSADQKEEVLTFISSLPKQKAG